MSDVEEEADDADPLDPSTAHPRAVDLLKEDWFWDCTDENSPLGNDTGADVLDFYREWREEHPGAKCARFLRSLLEEWEVEDAGWDVVEASEAEAAAQSDAFSFSMRNEIALALAYAQLLVDGNIEEPVRARALHAIARQLLPFCLAHWGGEAEQQARAARLQVMHQRLIEA